MRIIVIGMLAIVALALARWSIFTVDASEFVYVTVLGRHTATFDGSIPAEAGLHAGWPWPVQSAQRLDRRVQIFDLPTTEFLTHDPKKGTIDKTLSVDAYVLWQIADAAAVDRFIRRLASTERAREILASRIRSQLGATIGRMRMEDLISTEPGKEPGTTRVDDTISQLQQGLVKAMRDQVREEYGIDLLDIRLRRLSHPSEVRASIFERIRSERRSKVVEYQAEGDLLARNIESKADEEVREKLAKARFEEATLKSKAETEALRLRNHAQSQDPEFYSFLKQMEKLQSILGDNRSVLLLSTHRSIFDLLFQPPRPKTPDGKLSPEIKK